VLRDEGGEEAVALFIPLRALRRPDDRCLHVTAAAAPAALAAKA
jgi:hypothetical protein